MAGTVSRGARTRPQRRGSEKSGQDSCIRISSGMTVASAGPLLLPLRQLIRPSG